MTSRKDFLIAGTLAASIPGLAEAAVPSPAATPFPWPKLKFDLAAFNAILDGPQTYKNLFSSVAIEEGTIFAMIRNTLDGYRDVGVPLSDVQPVAVLYHGLAVTMGYDDEVWDTYVIPAAARANDLPAGAKAFMGELRSVLKPGAKGNPFLASGSSSIPALVRDAGLRLFLCNDFTRGFSAAVAHALGRKPLGVYADIAAHLAPNATLAPNGVWAMHAVQSHHFTLLPVNVRRAT